MGHTWHPLSWFCIVLFDSWFRIWYLYISWFWRRGELRFEYFLTSSVYMLDSFVDLGVTQNESCLICCICAIMLKTSTFCYFWSSSLWKFIGRNDIFFIQKSKWITVDFSSFRSSHWGYFHIWPLRNGLCLLNIQMILDSFVSVRFFKLCLSAFTKVIEPCCIVCLDYLWTIFIETLVPFENRIIVILILEIEAIFMTGTLEAMVNLLVLLDEISLLYWKAHLVLVKLQVVRIVICSHDSWR